MSLSVEGRNQLASDMVAGDRQQTEADKEAFLKLLVTQISNQDPMSAEGGSEQFMEQLSQYSMLEQMMNLNEGLNRLALGQVTANNQGALNLVGKEVTAQGDLLTLEEEGGSVPVGFEVPEGAERVKLRITDAQGNLVRTLEMGAPADGVGSRLWDGTNEEGDRVPPGIYQVSVSATDADGNALEGQARVRGRVTGIRFEEGYPELFVGGRRIAMSDVLEVQSPAPAGPANEGR